MSDSKIRQRKKQEERVVKFSDLLKNEGDPKLVEIPFTK